MPGASISPRRARAGRSFSDDAQRAVRLRQHAASSFLDHDVVLDPHPAPTRDVDAGLDRESHTDLEHGLRPWVEARILVAFQSNAVADPVEELLAIAAGFDDGPCRRVDISGRHPGAYRRARGLVPRQHELVDLTLLGARFADDRHPGAVGLVTAER